MEKYFEMLNNIEESKINIVKLYLLSAINMAGKSEEEEWKMVNYCYDLWLDSDVDLDLGKLADIVVWNWKKIQNDGMTDETIIDMCMNY